MTGPDDSASGAAPDAPSSSSASAPTFPLPPDPGAPGPRFPGPPPPRLSPSVTAPRFGGGVSLMIALLGLVGAAIGAGWLQLDTRFGLSPTGLFGLALNMAALVLAIIGALLVVGALGYYVLAPAFGAPGAAWRGVGSHRLVIATTVLIVLLANAGPLVYVALVGPSGLCSVSGFVTAAVSVDVVLLAITYLRFIRPGVLTVADLGLDRARLPYLIGFGIALGFGILIASGVVQATLQAITGVKQTQMAGISCVREFPLAGFLAVVATGGVLAPIAEELFFRGYVFRSYYQTQRPWVAYGATSALFATLHLNLPALLPILVLSVLLCWAYRKTGSIIPSVVGHALNNTAAFCILYFTTTPL